MAFGTRGAQKSRYITRWATFRSRSPPTDSPEEALWLSVCSWRRIRAPLPASACLLQVLVHHRGARAQQGIVRVGLRPAFVQFWPLGVCLHRCTRCLMWPCHISNAASRGEAKPLIVLPSRECTEA